MIPYFQTTPFTTAASSLLTILHYFNKAEATQQQEFKIWQKTVTLPTRGSSIYALAQYAAQKGLQPKLVVEDKQYKFPDYRFYRYTKQDIDHATLSATLHLKTAEQHVEIEERPITFEEIKEKAKDHFIILRVNAKPLRNSKRNTSNYIVVHNYQNKQFSLIDPATAAFTVPEQLLEEALISLKTKKYRDNRMILFPKKYK